MAEIVLANKIANLEGLKKLRFGDRNAINTPGLRITLAALEDRVGRLERLNNIDRPPPMLEPTMESLTYRLRRVEDRSLHPEKRLNISRSAHSIPKDTDELTKNLRKLVSRITEGVQPPSDKLMNGEELPLGEISQQLCFICGHRNIIIWDIDISDDPAQLWLLAIELSLDMENGVEPHTIWGSRPKHHLLRPGRNAPDPSTCVPKACCGCCSCLCHQSRPRVIPVPPPKIKERTTRLKTRRGFFSFAWVKRIFRKPNHDDSDDDSSSVTSRTTRTTSSTIVE